MSIRSPVLLFEKNAGIKETTDLINKHSTLIFEHVKNINLPLFLRLVDVAN